MNTQPSFAADEQPREENGFWFACVRPINTIGSSVVWATENHLLWFPHQFRDVLIG